MNQLICFDRPRKNRCAFPSMLLSISLALLTCACDRQADVVIAPTNAPDAATSSQSEATSAPTLRMTIDGVPWIADHAIDGMVNPPGYDRAVLISGSHGPKDKDEQAFTLMLLDVAGSGTFHVKSGGGNSSVAQMANLSPARYLAGGVLGYDLQVELVRVSASPVLIEACFSGSLNANDSSAMVISDGYFFYSE